MGEEFKAESCTCQPPSGRVSTELQDMIVYYSWNRHCEGGIE